MAPNNHADYNDASVYTTLNIPQFIHVKAGVQLYNYFLSQNNIRHFQDHESKAFIGWLKRHRKKLSTGQPRSPAGPSVSFGHISRLRLNTYCSATKY